MDGITITMKLLSAQFLEKVYLKNVIHIIRIITC